MKNLFSNTRKANELAAAKDFQWPYKALIVLLGSTIAWAVLIYAYPQHFHSGGWIGAMLAFQQMLGVLIIGHLLLRLSKKYTWLSIPSILFAPVPHRSLAMIFSSMATFYSLIGDWQVVAWDVYLLLHIVLSFLAGASFALLLFYVAIQRFFTPQSLPFQLDRARVDMFSGTLVASVLLGSTFHITSTAGEPSEGVLFPLVLGLWNIGITSIGAVLVGNKPKQSRWWFTVSSAAAVLMMIIATELVRAYLPAFWTFGGREYLASNALLAVELGLLAGWAAGIIIRFYDRISLWYIDYLLEQKSKGVKLNILMRLFINIILPVLPMLLVTLALLGSFVAGGLYGTSLALLGILSNVGLSMVIEANSLNAKKLPISDTEKRKLELLSPSFPQMLSLISRQRFGLKR